MYQAQSKYYFGWIHLNPLVCKLICLSYRCGNFLVFISVLNEPLVSQLKRMRTFWIHQPWIGYLKLACVAFEISSLWVMNGGGDSLCWLGRFGCACQRCNSVWSVVRQLSGRERRFFWISWTSADLTSPTPLPASPWLRRTRIPNRWGKSWTSCFSYRIKRQLCSAVRLAVVSGIALFCYFKVKRLFQGCLLRTPSRLFKYHASSQEL